MTRIRASLILAMVVATVAGLVFRGAQTDPQLAELGRATIRESDFLRYLESTHPPEHVAQLRRDAAAWSREVEAYLDVRAIGEKAQRQRLDDDVAFTKAVALAETRILAQLSMKPFREQLARAASVSAEELRDYYEQRRNDFRVEPRFTAHHLLVYVEGNPAFPDRGLPHAVARAKAARALVGLKKGDGWVAVARSYSDDIPTKERGGFLHDRQFGYLPAEVEEVLRTQPLGQPSGVIRTALGYYVVEVVDRTTEPVAKPFEAVRDVLLEELTERRTSETRSAILEPMRRAVGFQVTDIGRRDAPLFDANAIAPDAILAEVGAQPIRESDFIWFCRDALLPHQRKSADARPGARQGLLRSYLDLLVLAAKARIDHLDATPEFNRRRNAQLAQLRAEFVRERDVDSLAKGRLAPHDTPEAAERAYLDRIRADVGLRLIGSSRP